MKKGKKFLALALVLMLATSLVVGCGGGGQDQPAENPEQNAEQPEAPFKVAALLPGPINDNGFNASAYEGLKLVEQELGAEIAYQENTPQSDFEEVFRGYASQGFNVIIGHGFQFADAAKKVAQEFPDTIFLMSDSREGQEPNVGSYSVLAKEAGFLGGVVAATYTQSDKVAIVGGLSIPPVTDMVDGFVLGAKYANPDVEALTTITGSFEDVAKAKEMAKVFIQDGADIVMHQADQAGLGVIEAAKEHQVPAIGVIKDQSGLAPDTVLVSAFRNIPEGILYMVTEIKNGNFKPQFHPLGAKEDVVGLIWNPEIEDKVSAEARAQIDQIVQDLKDGKIDVENLE